LSIGFKNSVSFLPAIQATGLLIVTPVGLSPTEHASLRWTYVRTCTSPRSIAGGISPVMSRRETRRYRPYRAHAGRRSTCPGWRPIRRRFAAPRDRSRCRVCRARSTLSARANRGSPDPVDLEFRFLKCDPHEQLFEPASLLGPVAALLADVLEDGTRARPSGEVEAPLRNRHGWNATLDSCRDAFGPRWSGRMRMRTVTPPSPVRYSRPASAASAMGSADVPRRAPTGSRARSSR